MKNQQSFKPIYFLLTGILTILLANCSQPGYIQQNNLLVANEQTDTAIANYRHLLVEDPDDGELHYQLAKILSRQENYSEAIKSVEKAIIIDHLIDRYQLLAGKIKYTTHDNFEAINHLTNALILNPQYLEVYYYLGLALEKTGQTAKALEQFQAAISIEPLYFDAHLAWVEIKFRQLTQTGLNGTSSPDQDINGKAADSETATDTPGQSGSTRKEFLLLTKRLESALKIEPDSVPGHLLLSKIYYSLGAEYKARILLENWLRDFEHDDRILLALAQLEYRSGRFDSASRILSQQRQPGLESQVLRLKVEIKNVSTPETSTKIHALLKKYPDSDTLFLLSGQWELK
ncbi:MAG: tetratricopeptide repeat protein, partial [Deltaproteobacteria bacterium]|nr:tetratricopeptide repeat protein [Deltaproteobacteria bacterium]